MVLTVTGTESVSPFETGGKGAPLVAPMSTSNACACRFPNARDEAETETGHTVKKLTSTAR